MSLPFARHASRSGAARRNALAGVMLGVVLGLPSAPLQAQMTLTQNASNTITAGNSVACASGTLTRPNSYFRTFTLADFSLGAPFAISAVEIGIEEAFAGSLPGGTIPLELSIFGNSTGVPGTFASFGAPLFSQVFNVANQTLSLQSFLTPALVTTPGFTLQISAPDLQPHGGRFFIGSNSAGQTAASYIATADCSIHEPTSLTNVGFPDMHIVMNVKGTPMSTVPEPSTYALMVAGLAGMLVVARRRRRAPLA